MHKLTAKFRNCYIKKYPNKFRKKKERKSIDVTVATQATATGLQLVYIKKVYVYLEQNC